MTHPPIRSFVLRQGRYSPAQQRAVAELMPRYGVPYRAAPLDFAVASCASIIWRIQTGSPLRSK